MTGKLLQLGRDGTGIIATDAPSRQVYGLAKSMLQPPDMSLEDFLQLEGKVVQFEVIDDCARNVRPFPV